MGPEDGCPEENLQYHQATQIFGTYNQFCAASPLPWRLLGPLAVEDTNVHLWARLP